MTEIAQTPTRVQRYGAVVIRYRWPIMAVAVLLVVIMAAGGRNLTITNDSRVFFSEDNPQLVALEALEDTYTETNNVYIGLAPKAGGSVFTRETLAAIEWLTEQSWLVPHSNRVDSITNYSHSYGTGDELIVEDLVTDAAALSEADIERVKDIALNEDTLVNRILASDGGATAININTLTPDENSDAAVDEIMAYVDGMLAQARQDYPDLEFYLTGGIVTSKAFGEATMNDMAVLGPFILVAIVVVMMVLLRSVVGTIGTLVVVLFSTLTAMGIAGWAGMVLSPGSAGAPTIIMTIAIAHSVHVVTTMRQWMRRGLSKHEAIVESLRVNMHPYFSRPSPRRSAS